MIIFRYKLCRLCTQVSSFSNSANVYFTNCCLKMRCETKIQRWVKQSRAILFCRRFVIFVKLASRKKIKWERDERKKIDKTLSPKGVVVERDERRWLKREWRWMEASKSDWKVSGDGWRRVKVIGMWVEVGGRLVEVGEGGWTV